MFVSPVRATAGVRHARFQAAARGGTLPPYKEVIQQIPCLYKGELRLYVAQIWVDTDAAMTSGRELGGYPKKLADIGLDWSGDLGSGYLERSYEKPLSSGNRIASYSLKKTGRMVSIPLPADRKPTFPFPYNLTLPLPEPTGNPQALPFSTACTRVSPNIGGPFGLTQLCGMKWTLEKGEIWAADASLSFRPSHADPLSHLPVNQILDAIVFYGDMYAVGEFLRELVEARSRCTAGLVEHMGRGSEVEYVKVGAQ